MMLRLRLLIALVVVSAVVRALQVRPTVWSVFGDIAAKTGASNLGQGFPDWDPPEFVLDSLRRSVSHQYTRPAGHPQLVELLAERYENHLDHEVHPMNNIAITVGASQALFLTLTTLLERGDEIVMFDPFFELYTKQIKLTGATPKFVPLGGAAATLDNPWALNVDALRESVLARVSSFVLLSAGSNASTPTPTPTPTLHPLPPLPHHPHLLPNPLPPLTPPLLPHTARRISGAGLNRASVKRTRRRCRQCAFSRCGIA
mmetsp:Transcript_14135/g.31013  ORF Transcript_14135/g.31013 Transcript_14135/m.31013 type:complete len:259 (+) Transcript_14135:155-931(+)